MVVCYRYTHALRHKPETPTLNLFNVGVFLCLGRFVYVVCEDVAELVRVRGVCGGVLALLGLLSLPHWSQKSHWGSGGLVVEVERVEKSERR